MPCITNISSRLILNSRAKWTLETCIELSDGSEGVASVPDGASKGEDEAVSLDALEAVSLINNDLASNLLELNPYDQKTFDAYLCELDGTENKSKLGGNTILSLSLAVCRAAAVSKKLELYAYIAQLFDIEGPLQKGDFPVPVFNILNGGLHAGNNLSFQEFMVIPAKNVPFDESIKMGVEVYHNLYNRLKSENLGTDVGNEGGFAPSQMTPRKALEYVRSAAAQSYQVGEQIFLGSDVAAGSFYSNGVYNIKEENMQLDLGDYLSYCSDLLSSFEIIYFEDPFYEKSLDAWEQFSTLHNERTLIVGDDLLVTNTKFLKEAINRQLANAVIVKPNQVGTLTQTLAFVKMARAANMQIIVSHRSGETNDSFIADLALGVRADFIKTGAPARGERVAKYNRLLQVFNLI